MVQPLKFGMDRWFHYFIRQCWDQSQPMIIKGIPGDVTLKEHKYHQETMSRVKSLVRYVGG